MKRILLTGLIGGVFGAVLERLGFADHAEVLKMFRFESLRLTFAFAIAVLLLAAALRLVPRLRAVHFPAQPLHRGTWIGGLSFGVGWALCGVCPSSAWVRIGTADLSGLWALGGVALGIVGADWLQTKWPSLRGPSCEG